MQSGGWYRQVDGSISGYQSIRAMYLHPRVYGHLGGIVETELVDDSLKSQCHSLLGGIMWTVPTRTGSAINVQDRQRHVCAARVADCRQVNTLLQFLGKHNNGIIHPCNSETVRCINMTCTAVETVFTAGEPVSVNLLEWFVRRRYRRIRPTFTAEPSTLTNSTGTHNLLQSALHQVYCGTQERADELHQKRETGSLYPPIDLLVITHSVSGTVTAPDVFIPQETFSKLQLITNRDWFARGLFKSVSGTEALPKSRIEQTRVTEPTQGRVTVVREVKTQWRTSSRGHPEGHDGDNNEKFWSVDQTQFSRVLARSLEPLTHFKTRGL